MKAIIFALAAMMVFAAASRSEEVIKEGDGWNRIQIFPEMKSPNLSKGRII